jgi:peptidylprolyl isomerase
MNVTIHNFHRAWLIGLIFVLLTAVACGQSGADNGESMATNNSSQYTGTNAPTAVDEADYTVTDSGLKYYDIVEGDGPLPEAGKTVIVHYTGWLTDGTKFDSSRDRGQPFPFPLGQGRVIAGWDEGVATMKAGTIRQLVIPPELAYGAQGAGSVIPPNATLIFEVELIGDE